jgi:large conductance mechanosensitive channel
MREELSMKNWANEFKAFIMRGNVVDLAIAVVIGAAFSGIVTALVNGIIMPLIGAIGGKPNFDAYWWNLNGSRILVGTFLTALVNFLIIAAVIFFLVLKPINAVLALRKHEEKAEEPTTRECPYCLSQIPLKATRCAYCTAEVPTLAEVAAEAKA